MTVFDVNNFDEFHIGLASAEKIRSWSHAVSYTHLTLPTN